MKTGKKLLTVFAAMLLTVVMFVIPSFAAELPNHEQLQNSLRAVVAEKNGGFRSSLQLQPSRNFEAAH
ncbi:MAG: hypothetical protein WCQ99_03045, partial [Pseudomonadota bacterium]